MNNPNPIKTKEKATQTQSFTFSIDRLLKYSSSTGQFFPKREKSLFDQVVARYKDELTKLEKDEDFKPLYIGIRQAGDEIHVWVLVEDTDQHSYGVLRQIESDLNQWILPLDHILLSFYFYPKYHGKATPPKTAYQELYRAVTQ